jgi:uncharacterized membrane protein
MKSYVYLFFMSMLPIVELRLAIPVSQAMDLPVVKSFVVCMIGNMVPVPFIYFFARRFLNWGKNKKFTRRPCTFLLEKGEKAGAKILNKTGKYGAFLALTLFVGIPLPGTGAWTGTLAASILDLGFKKTVFSVTAGVVLAGVIMMTASYFGLSFID